MKLNLTKKIMLMTGTVLLVSVLGIGVVSVVKSKSALNGLAKDELVKLAAMSKSLCQVAALQAQDKAAADIKIASSLFRDYSNRRVEVRDGQMIVDPGGRNLSVNGNFQFVDQVAKETGSHCTIFLRESGQAKRISTTVLDDKGNRAINTLASQAVYDAVIGRESSYKGRAWVVNAWYTTCYEPIRDIHNQVVGILFVGVKEGAGVLRQAMLNHKIGETGYIYAIDSKGVLQIHPAKEGADISNYDFIKEMCKKGPSLAEGEIGWITYPWMNKELGDTKEREKGVAYAYFKDWDWIIGVGSYLDEFNAPAVAVRNAIIYIGVGLLFLSLAMAFLLSRSVTRPVIGLVKISDEMSQEFRELERVIGNYADNDFTQQIAASKIQRITVKSSDETGILVQSIQTTLDSKEQMVSSLDRLISSFVGTIRQLSDNSAQLVSAATEIASSSEQMARGSQEQTDQTAQVSSAVEEMTATIVESSKNAGEAAGQAKEAANAARAGNQLVSQTIEGMNRIAQVVQESAKTIQELETSSDKIGEIIVVIDDIADQTNLLALNAAIEAARAGEQGRGFAVVADEVRKLAERTGKATKEITDMIKGIQNDTKGAVASMEQGINEVQQGRELADRAGESLTQIAGFAQKVMDMVQQIATAAEEQSAASEQIARSVEGIARVTKENAAGVEQSAAAAEELNHQAEGMQQMVGRFRVK